MGVDQSLPEYVSFSHEMFGFLRNLRISFFEAWKPKQFPEFIKQLKLYHLGEGGESASKFYLQNVDMFKDKFGNKVYIDQEIIEKVTKKVLEGEVDDLKQELLIEGYPERRTEKKSGKTGLCMSPTKSI